MAFVTRLKREISKHPAKAGVLGVLVVVMVVFCIKAVFELSPRGAAASAIEQATQKTKTPENAPPVQAVSESMQESGMLWGKLKEVKSSAVGSEWAFRFDSSLYGAPMQDQSKRTSQAPEPQETVKPAPTPAVMMESDTERTKRIMGESQKLTVQSTAVGNGTVQPLAIVNNQMLTAGNTIMGFEIVAIRSREVQFRKEGVLLTRKMLDDPRGQ